MNQIFEDKSPEERVQLLRDNAVSCENMNVRVFFTEEELASMKNNLSDISIEENELKEELKAISSELRIGIKARRENIKGLLKNLKDKHILQMQEVYHMDDQEEGVMNTYNSEGTLIASRKLLQKERQTRIKNLTKTA